jgi:hypothetical protein
VVARLGRFRRDELADRIHRSDLRLLHIDAAEVAFRERHAQCGGRDDRFAFALDRVVELAIAALREFHDDLAVGRDQSRREIRGGHGQRVGGKSGQRRNEAFLHVVVPSRMFRTRSQSTN